MISVAIIYDECHGVLQIKAIPLIHALVLKRLGPD